MSFGKLMEKEIDPDIIKLYKRKGQHILIDKQVIKRQVDYAQLSKEETVLEIGFGLGALTFKLAERAKKVVAIEKDPRLFSLLKDQVPSNVELINADVMKLDLPKFDIVVSNLPYQISSPVTFKLLNEEFDKGILMYQREFAQRMIAKSGEKAYSRLSVNVYYKANCRLLEYVSKEAFHPMPEVDSAIVELIPRKPPFPVQNEDMFFKVVEATFGQRRKKIKNSLVSLVSDKLKENGIYNKTKIREIMQDLPFSDERVETLTPEKIGILADYVYLFSLSS